MGNYRFRLADMMPNAWFYKLRDMSRAKSTNPAHALRKKQPTSTVSKSKSFYNATTTTIESSIAVDRYFASPRNTKSFDTRFPYDPPRRSSRKRAKRKTIYMPSPRKNAARTSSDYGFVIQETGGFPAWLRAGTGSEEVEEDFDESESNGYDSFDSLCKLSSSTTDIIIDVDEISCNEMHVVDGSTTTLSFDMVSELEELPPILTRPKKLPNDPSVPPKFHNKNYNNIEPKRTPGRKSMSRSGGVRIRGNGAKIASKKGEARHRKSSEKAPCEKNSKGRLFGSESFAIVKSSFDPEKDFRDSMMEMIVENNIRTSKDLEELLACYLSLNSNQYHHTIIKAFEQIWFNMHQLQI